MGGFTEGPTPTPAPEYPPENAIDITSAIGNAWDGMKKAGAVSATGAHTVTYEPGWLVKELISFLGMSGEVSADFLEKVRIGWEPILQALLKTILAILRPGVELGQDLSATFVSVLVDGLKEVRSSDVQGNITGLKTGAQAMFDGVMAPLAGLTNAASPATPGAGQTNAQYTLGGIIAVHLQTWLINVIANITNSSVLKFINSFDEAVTGCLNARSLGRGALKPYMDKMIATPLTRDLNVAMPLAIGSASQLIKRYLRGNITAPDLKTALRGLGYDDEVVGDQLLDAAKLLTVSQVVYLVKMGQWDGNQAMAALVQTGYPATLAAAAYQIEMNSVVDSQKNALADDLLTLLKDHRMAREDFVIALQSAKFTPDEVQAYSLRGAYAQEIPKRLTYTQVKSLYAENLVDLNYVADFLAAEGYSNGDADLLVLNEFTKKEARDQAIKLLASIRRAQLEQGLKDQAAADAARKAALALLPT